MPRMHRTTKTHPLQIVLVHHVETAQVRVPLLLDHGVVEDDILALHLESVVGQVNEALRVHCRVEHHLLRDAADVDLNNGDALTERTTMR